MKKTLRTATLILIAGLIVLSLSSLVKSQPPPIPMTIEGYVTIQKINGTNITAPAGLNVYAKQDTTVYSNISGTTPTNAQGYYTIAVTGPVDYTPIDLWVQDINVTTITFNQSQVLQNENLTVVDTTPPTIQVLSPQPQAIVSTTQPVWVNATLTDNLAIDPTTISMTLNQTPLVWTFNSTTGLLSSQTGPLAKGLYIANITVSDIAGNTATETWNFTASVVAPPIVTITSPVNGAYVTTSPVWINGTVTSSDMGTLQPTINDSRFTLSAWVSTTGAFSFSNATTIPNGPLSANVSFTDLAGNIGSQTVTFTVDTAPPVIGTPTQVPAASSVQPNEAVMVSASIIDTISGVSNATLSYSNDTVTWYNVAMTLNSTTGLWQATIPGYPGGSSISYYVSAYDGAGNHAVNNNTGTYYVYVVLSEFPTVTALLMLMVFAAALIVLTKRRKTTKT